MATVRKLTKRGVDAARPKKNRYDVMCETLKGFGVRVQPTGTKTYFYYYRGQDGRGRRPKIGEHGPITCEQARKIAEDWYLLVRKGKDPSLERKKARGALTMDELCDRYLEERAVEPRMKPRSIKTEKHLIKKHVRPRYGRRTIESINTKQLESLRRRMVKTPGAYNKAIGLLKRMFNFAIEEGMRVPGTNPCVGVKLNREKKIERFLSAAERKRLKDHLKAAEKTKTRRPGYVHPGAIGAIRLLCVTGARTDEILSAEWSMVDWDARLLKLPDCKEGGPKDIWLNEQAIEILEWLRELGDDSPYICPNTKGKKITSFTRLWARVREDIELEDVRVHDLRHSYASDAIMAGVPLQLVGNLLGHKRPQTTARYAHVADKAAQEAAEAIGATIDEAARKGGTEKAASDDDSANNVVELPRRRRGRRAGGRKRSVRGDK